MPQVAPNDPATWNTLTLLPRFGIFDIVVRMSEPVVESPLTDAQSVDLLVTSLAGPPVAAAMPMWEDGSGTLEHRVANFSFAVPLAQGHQHFDGTLVLTAEQAGPPRGRLKTVRLPLRVGAFERVADLFVFFLATAQNRRPQPEYCWVKVPARIWVGAPNTVPAVGATVDAKILRDNFRNGFDRRNRRVALRTDATGTAAFPHANGDRTVLAFPTAWPMIFTATLGGHVPRAHLARFERADIDHNRNPHQVSAVRIIPIASARGGMSASTVLIDPGHGVVYAFASQRRSQEWFVAHRIGVRVREILHDRFGVPEANLFMTRTAGFGLIDPGEVGRQDAPERGARRFVFEPAGRRLRIAHALGLHDLSDLVLTGADDTPANVAPAARDHLIQTNGATVAAIIARIQGSLPAGQRVQAGSVRWSTATSRYVCRIERHPPVAAQNPIVDDARPVAITVNDWFALDGAMLANLAHRTARWSVDLELGSGPAANAATGRPSFHAAMDAALLRENASDYMRHAIVDELALEEPYAPGAAIPAVYSGEESMAWHFRVRRDYINRKACHVAITIHENAAGGNVVDARGMAMLVGQGPPAAQVHAAKVFMKYVDPFDQGLRQGGVVESNAGMLAAQNTRRDAHVYFELEFMTSTILDNPEVRAADPSRYQYDEMSRAGFVDTVSEQIVAGVVEFLLDAQSDIDAVGYDGSLPTW